MQKERPGNRSYYLRTFLVAAVAVPLLTSLGAILGYVVIAASYPNYLIGIAVSAPILLVLLIGVWILHARRAPLPDSLTKRLAPIVIAFLYYLLVWVVLFGLAGYQLGSFPYGVFFILTAPYICITIVLAFGILGFFPLVLFVQLAIAVVTILIVSSVQKKTVRLGKGILIMGISVVLVCGIAGFQAYQKSLTFITPDYRAETIEGEIDPARQMPFAEHNGLAILGDDPAVSITADYPRLDGATAAYPVYAAIAQALYKGLDENSAKQYVRCSTTDAAYQSLIQGDIDLFFGAQPSKGERADAEKQGVAFELTPLGKEAFVFFVSTDNPVENLTLEQVQDIYQKKITNWKDVGGNDERILAFQRPENSGSQTVMEAKVMGDKTLPAPLQQERVDGMGGIVDGVAEYRNTSSAIGYSFRYYVTGMKQNDNVKLLAIEGVEPTAENIKNGSYPLTIDFYAVSAHPRSENTVKLVDWCLSEQGQAFIEQCGYVGID